MSSLDELAELRLALRRNGYSPVPISRADLSVKGAGKRPLMKNWATICKNADEGQIASWGKLHKTSTNTGIICGAVIAVDIDVLVEPVAAEIVTLAHESLGETPLMRIGRAPKRLLVFRADVPFAKMQTDEYHFPDGQIARVEILGLGQQFVAYGVHPDTQANYLWPDKTPADVLAEALPLVNAGQCTAFLAKAAGILERAGAESKTRRQALEQDGGKAARLGPTEIPSLETITDALNHVPNDLPYDDWIKIGFALYDGLGEKGRELWEQWSAKSAKNEPLLTASKYDTFSGSHSIRVRTLFWYAKQNGWRKRRARNQTADAGQPEAGLERPKIHITGGALPNILKCAENALIASNSGLYQRGGLIVRPAHMPVAIAGERKVTMFTLVQVKVADLRVILTAAAEWWRYDKREEAWVKKDCPKEIAEAYLAREGEWNLPVLTGLINRPTLRSDGSILDQPGYDGATGLLFDPENDRFPQVSGEPGRLEALEALGILSELISSFPFVTDNDRSVALSAILTTIIRHSLLTAPMHVFTAPVMGSGKSMLVDIVSMIATGYPAPVISQGKNDEETEKRVGAALIAGDQIISIDNCERPLDGALFAITLTQPRQKVRVLGLSKLVEVPTNVSLFATGNNLTITGDLPRRSLMCALDPQIERPWLRQFEFNPLNTVRAHRARYVMACLVVLRAYHCAKRPCRPPAFGSFEEYSDWVRGALLWLDQADPCSTMEAIQFADPKLDTLRTIFDQWLSIVGTKRISVRKLIGLANEQQQPAHAAEFRHPVFRNALLVVCGDGEVLNGRRLGKWLGINASRVVEGMRIVRDGILTSEQQWRLEAGVAGRPAAA